MAITDENKNKVITLEGLNHFYDRIKNAFLKKDDADTYYAGINGDSNIPFKVGNLAISDLVAMSYQPASDRNSAMLTLIGQEEEFQVNIPLVDGTMATTEQVNGKADVLAVTTSLKFCKQPHIQVFNSIYDTTSVNRVLTGSVVFFSVNSITIDSTLRSMGFTTNNAFYYCSGNDQFVYIGSVSPYVIYYNKAASSLCIWNNGTFSNIATGGGSIDPPSDYETATDTDIDGIIDIINGTTTDSE